MPAEPRTRSRRSLVLAGIVVMLVVFILGWWLTAGRQDGVPQPRPSDADRQTAAGDPNFDFSAHSLTDPASIWVIVNKHRKIQPSSYVPTLTLPAVPLAGNKDDPTMLTSTLMAPSLAKLVAAAKAAGNQLVLLSAYHSQHYQQTAATRHQAAPQTVPRVGFDEAQTGLTADVGTPKDPCNFKACFAGTATGKWLQTNAYRFGFVIRYPDRQQNITGYPYEPWHVRYVGTSAAGEMHRLDIPTLEDFFNLEDAPSYI